ncbi:hypothetical protein [Nocardioides marmorisolisilvae]|uniref:Ig-like domain repeat protein n=1 Tax=Nocardioides marmorisolisilvae TaxID=1542737 RepID=A0A3N0DXD5_9ACTN|nr:hypothetical protein [Nocardioides marmorisolisilvae]RNL80259.1 hypothetical protein EFL95_15300 [Nocardioides marmorisolisilvae]
MRSPLARFLLTGFGAAALIAGPASPIASADSPGIPVVTSVAYGNPDVLTVDWAGVPPALRVWGDARVTTTNGTSTDTVTSILTDSGSPRSRKSYRAGVCAPACFGSGATVTYGPWNHPSIPTSVNAAPPSLTATSGTKASPGVHITVTPGAQAGAPVFLIYNVNAVIGRVGPGNLSFVDTNPFLPQGSYSVQACYADCDQPEWPYWGDSYKPQSARSAVVKAYVANTAQCKTIGKMLYAFGQNWRNACKP